jgi:hypothetical protein
MKHRALIFHSLIFASILFSVRSIAQQKKALIPVIFSTDLFHPHDDPDDHFDSATLFAMPEFDLKCVILDQGKKQLKKSGGHVIDQLNYITGKHIPYATGLSDTLLNPLDKGLTQAEDQQAGVNMILQTLKNSVQPVHIIIVGSLRDVTAAYNRDSSLFKRKVARLHVFAGEASDTTKNIEYNVNVDRHAYTRLMQSSLPINWIPCFDGALWTNFGNGSFWNATHADLLSKSHDITKKFMLYMLDRKEGVNYKRYFEESLDESSAAIHLPKLRALWGAAVFSYIAGRSIIYRNGDYMSLPANENKRPGDIIVKPFDFKHTSVRFNDKGKAIYGIGENYHLLRKFFLLVSYAEYRKIMTSVTAYQLGELKQTKK